MKTKDKDSQKGFTLVELAIVVVIAGVAGFALVNTYTTLLKTITQNKTRLHLEVIQDALAAYVDRNLRLPCPVNPSFATMTPPMGYEAGSGPNGGNIPGDCPVIEGVVPFNTLSLPEEMTRDGYGNYITYRVARSHARDQRLGANVHENCRSTIWMHQPMNTAAGTAQNINPALARFCCRAEEGGNNDLDIEYRPQIAAALQDVWRLPVDNAAARYANVNTPAANPLPSNAVNRNNTRPIYVLVAHGANGVGAFQEDGTGRIGGFLGTDEAINASTISSQFAIKDKVLIQNNAAYFDDEIAWGTQDTLLARSGRFSCHAPSRY